VAASDRFREIFEGFAASETKESLYIEGQRRGIALSPVSTVQDLLDNEQLEARGFFVEPAHQRLGTKVRSPGTPFRLSGSEQIVLDGPTDEPVSPGDVSDGPTG
jgi:benzylsuccinate CoA-transferase BbsE subunit